MSCEMLQKSVHDTVDALNREGLDSADLNILLIRIIGWCHTRSHTNKLANPLPKDVIPSFLRKDPGGHLLVEHQIADTNLSKVVVHAK